MQCSCLQRWNWAQCFSQRVQGWSSIIWGTLTLLIYMLQTTVYRQQPGHFKHSILYLETSIHWSMVAENWQSDSTITYGALIRSPSTSAPQKLWTPGAACSSSSPWDGCTSLSLRHLTGIRGPGMKTMDVDLFVRTEVLRGLCSQVWSCHGLNWVCPHTSTLIAIPGAFPASSREWKVLLPLFCLHESFNPLQAFMDHWHYPKRSRGKARDVGFNSLPPLLQLHPLNWVFFSGPDQWEYPA